MLFADLLRHNRRTPDGDHPVRQSKSANSIETSPVSRTAQE